MPKSGEVQLVWNTEGENAVKLYLRVPSWTKGVGLAIKGESVSDEMDVLPNGSILIDRVWKKGDTVKLTFSMPVLFERADERVVSNLGYVSLRRGPIVYCAEAIDNAFDLASVCVDTASTVDVEYRASLDGKEDPYGVRDMHILKARGCQKETGENLPVTVTFVPFYARMNRGKGYMTVYVLESE